MANPKLAMFPQTIQEMTGQTGYNFRADLYYSDLKETTVSTATTFDIFTPPRAGDRIEAVVLDLIQSFQNTADTAFNTTGVTVGDSGDVDNLIVSIECNKNGTLGTFPAESTGDALPYAVPTTPLIIQLVITPTSGKALANLNRGHLSVRFKILGEFEPGFLLGAFGGELVGA